MATWEKDFICKVIEMIGDPEIEVSVYRQSFEPGYVIHLKKGDRHTTRKFHIMDLEMLNDEYLYKALRFMVEEIGGEYEKEGQPT